MKNYIVSAIIEARMDSTRLKGKVLKKINGKELIKILISRLKICKELDNIIIATSKNKSNYKLVSFLKKNKLKYFLGSEDNVLLRVYKTIKRNKSDIIVRLTGDNPLIDPFSIDYMVKYFKKNYEKYDYVTNNNFGNILKRNIAFGMDISLFKSKSFEKVFLLAKKKEHFEHPTLYFYREGKKIFKIKNIKLPKNMILNKKFRLTVDTKEDFLLIKKIVNYCNKYKMNFISLNDIELFFKKHPKAIDINKHVKQKTIN